MRKKHGCFYKKENKMLKYIFIAILVINQSCNIEQKKITLGQYLKDKRINSIKIEGSAKDSFYVLPNMNEIFDKMKEIKRSTGIWKYFPKKQLIIEYSSHEKDTLFTNGSVFQFGNLFFVHGAYLFEVSR